MKKLFYLIQSLGLFKIILYILLYPLRYLGGYLDWAQSIRSEKRSHSTIYKYGPDSLIQSKVLSAERKNEIKNYYKKYGLSINTRWHETFYSINERDSNQYISEYHFYQFIEPHFNDMRMVRSFSDKNLYSRHFSGVSQPKTILRYIRNTIYNEHYEEIDEKSALEKLYNIEAPVIIKPSVQSGAGRDVNILKSEEKNLYINNEQVSFSEILKQYKTGFIIQNRVQQYDLLDTLYPHSLNTIKLVTFRYQNSYRLLAALFRMGNHGNYLDNMHQGGICCGIQSDGRLQEMAYNGNLEKVQDHPYTKISFESIKIPNYSSLIDTVFKLHEVNLYCDIASWDFGIDKTGTPILIETNLKSQGIFFQQIINGPLFGEMTDAVLSDVFLKRS